MVVLLLICTVIFVIDFVFKIFFVMFHKTYLACMGMPRQSMKLTKYQQFYALMVWLKDVWQIREVESSATFMVRIALLLLE